jgi:hypothetical protein
MCKSKHYITNFMGHDLTIIVVWNMFSIGSYGIYINVIHLFILFEHQCCMHYLNMNVICVFILFKPKCYMFICVVYTRKLCTWFLCLNNARHLCLNNVNLWSNKFHMYLKQTHEPCKFVLWQHGLKMLKHIFTQSMKFVEVEIFFCQDSKLYFHLKS